MGKYEKLADFIIDHVGGKDNIESANHCMTRLRIKLKDPSKADREALNDNKDIISTQVAEGKLQIIIGTQVGEVYEDFVRLTGASEAEDNKEEKKGSLLNRFAALITKIVVPSLGVLCACGIIAGINSVLLATGAITTGSGANILLSDLGNACLTFFPVILGYTSAVAFGMDPFVGMIIGAFLIYPGIADAINTGDPLFTIFNGTGFAMPIYKTFFGIPIIFPTTGYTSTVIPIMLVNYFASKIEKWLKAHLPNVTKQFMAPFLTILIAGILGGLVIGPTSMLLQNGLQVALNFLIDKSKILAFAIITLIYQPLVIFGLHWPLITLGLMEYAAGGSSLIVASIFPASFTHMAACLATFIRTKSTKMKNIALPAFLSACFCIIEPSIYGVTLPVKKRFGYCMAGGLVGGLILVLANAPMYVISMGVTGVLSFVNPSTKGFMGLVWCIIACAAAFTVTFTLTWVTYKPGEDGKNEDDVSYKKVVNVTHKKEIISSPMKGEVKAISEMKDRAFANESLGKGVCIEPEEGKIVAPFDGTIIALFPSGHAIGFRSKHGVELMVHVGKDTFNLPEGTFTKLKNQGDNVSKGDTVITFDLEKLKKAGYDPETAVVVSNTKDYLDVVSFDKKKVSFGDDLLATVVSKPNE